MISHSVSEHSNKGLNIRLATLLGYVLSKRGERSYFLAFQDPSIQVGKIANTGEEAMDELPKWSSDMNEIIDLFNEFNFLDWNLKTVDKGKNFQVTITLTKDQKIQAIDNTIMRALTKALINYLEMAEFFKLRSNLNFRNSPNKQNRIDAEWNHQLQPKHPNLDIISLTMPFGFPVVRFAG